jgi:hypothetical protein
MKSTAAESNFEMFRFEMFPMFDVRDVPEELAPARAACANLALKYTS